MKTEKGLPLGLVNSEYSEIGLTLRADDRILLYTDGAVEATNGEGEEYGTSRLVRSLQKPGASAESVLADVHEFASGGTLNDASIKGTRRFYSVRSARIGSNLEARQAGARQARTATASSVAITPQRTNGSRGLVPKSMD